MEPQAFETLYAGHFSVLQRYVYYRLPSKDDGDDVLQEIALAALSAKEIPADTTKQKAWLLGIARHKIADYYRRRERTPSALPEDYDMPAYEAMYHPVNETLAALPPRHQALLERAYLHGYSLRDIACESSVPLGTVKSRLYAAREAFRQEYEKGEKTMKKTFPKTMPAVCVIPGKLPVFSVDCIELGAWFFRALEGEACDWCIYDMPGIDGREQSELTNLTCVRYLGRTVIHGVEGLAFEAKDISTEEESALVRWFAVQKTDTHVRWLAESHDQGGAKKIATFLDDDFLRSWGEGEENIGVPIHLPAERFDGRFTVQIGGRAHDTVRLRTYGKRFPGFHDRYLNAEGRTVLFQEFAPPEVLIERGYQVDERAERVEYEGQQYLHWYDCISDWVVH